VISNVGNLDVDVVLATSGMLVWMLSLLCSVLLVARLQGVEHSCSLHIERPNVWD
jgi:hypothetical protein